jgi:peroxiredoxin
MKKRVWIQRIVGGLLLALIAGACGRSDKVQPASSAEQQAVADIPVGTDVGQRAPDFTLNDLAGNPVSLSDFHGQPVLLNFMHTWCQPCNASAPGMAAAYEANKGKGFTILSVDVEESGSATKAFIDKYGLNYPFVLDPDGQIVREYGVRGVPTSFFLDSSGVIRSVIPGEVSREWIEDNLNSNSS